MTPTDTEIDYVARVRAALDEAGYPMAVISTGIYRTTGLLGPTVISGTAPLEVVWRAFWVSRVPGLLCWPCWKEWVANGLSPHSDCTHDPYAPDAELPPVVR